jgi:hypothetical protein
MTPIFTKIVTSLVDRITVVFDAEVADFAVETPAGCHAILRAAPAESRSEVPPMPSSSRFITPSLVLVTVILSAVGCGASTKVQMPSPAERVLLNDEFNQYNPQWRTVRGQWAVQAGSAVQVRDDAREQNTIMYFDPLITADAEVATAVKMSATLPQFPTASDAELIEARRRIAGAGLVFRYQDENNYYMFRLAGEDGVVLGKMVDGKWQDIANPRAADFGGTSIKMDTEYTLRVRTEGRRIQCWINGRAVANLEDASFSTGKVGLVTFRTRAAFSSIRVVER